MANEFSITAQRLAWNAIKPNPLPASSGFSTKMNRPCKKKRQE
jgi:hypothetical protein